MTRKTDHDTGIQFGEARLGELPLVFAEDLDTVPPEGGRGEALAGNERSREAAVVDVGTPAGGAPILEHGQAYLQATAKGHCRLGSRDEGTGQVLSITPLRPARADELHGNSRRT